VKHLCCAQKPRNRSSGDAKTKKTTKSTVAWKLFFLKNTLSVFHDTFHDGCQRGGIAPCTAEVWLTSSLYKLRTSQKQVWRPLALTRPWGFGGV
jgi:hypothetical protein